MTGSVGAELRRARERAQLSLQDLAARTKIRVVLLEAIERDEFERLPAGLLTRGFLRAYAREVGLDPESIVRQYVSELAVEQSALAVDRQEPQSDSEWETSPAGRPRWPFLIPAIPVALAALFFLRVHVPDDRATREEPVLVGTAGEPISPVAFEPAVAAITPPPEERVVDAALAVPDAAGLRLEIHPAAVVWVDAVADGTPVLYELIEAGERRTIDVRTELTMRIGDAAAFAYSINGVPGRPLGAPGQVRDIRITRDNYESFVIRD